jgi:hypothetical protein
VASEHPDAAEFIETESAVHVVFRVDRDWDGEREAAVAETERKMAGLRAFIASAPFHGRFGTRTGVLRMRTGRQPPSIVAHLMADAGVEIEAEDRPRADPGERCAFCGRSGLWEDQVSMTERGWACPSCFRAWSVQQDARLPRVGHLPGERRLPGWAWTMGLLLLLTLCVYGAYWTLDRMNGMNHVIRSHLPSGQ